MVPTTLKPQLKAWATKKASLLLLDLAFSITLEDAQNACRSLGGVEFSEISEDLQKYASGIEATLEACAHKILKHFSEKFTLQRHSPTQAKYGEKIITLRGGESQFKAMQSAETFLKQIFLIVEKIKNADIQSPKNFKEWLTKEFSGRSLDQILQNLEVAAIDIFPFAQRLEKRTLEESKDSNVWLHTCLWNTIESENPFTIKDKNGNVLAEDTLHAEIEASWPASICVNESLLILK